MSQVFLEDVPAARLTSTTIRRMYELIDQAKTDPKFQELAYAITNGLRSKDYRGEIERFYNWAKREIRYTRDPHGVELVQDVWSTIKRGRADCDDFSILLGALSEVMGAPVQIVTVSTRPDKEPVHVYPEVKVGGRWLPLDATVAGARVGWAPKKITDRIVWKRSDVGISGYDDETIEGLGMFKSTMRPVNMTPGVPNDISHTFADPMRGETVVSRRLQPGAPYFKVATNSELVQSPAPGDLPYGTRMPVRPEPLPSQNWSSIRRVDVPITINPWPLQARQWKTRWGAMLPQTHVPEDREMTNLNGLGDLWTDSELDEIMGAIEIDVTRAVRSGQLPAAAAPEAIENAISAVRSGDQGALQSLPTTSRVARRVAGGNRPVSTPATRPHHGVTRGMRRGGNLRARASEYGCEGDPSCDWLPNMSGLGEKRISPEVDRARVYRAIYPFVKKHLPGAAHRAGVHPRRIQGLFRQDIFRRIKAGQMQGLGELGDTPLPVDPTTTANVASALTDGIMRTVDPTNAAAVTQAVQAGMQALIGQAPAPAKASLMDSFNLKGWGVPVAVLAAITGAAYFMSKPSRKYRRNPSRRRGGRSGGSDFEKYIPLAIGAVAAYMIFKPSAPPAGALQQPQQQGLLSSIMNMFKPSTPTSTQQSAQMVQAAANPFASIINSIFGPSKPATSSPAPAPSSSGSQFVFDRDLYSSSAPAPAESQFVTSL